MHTRRIVALVVALGALFIGASCANDTGSSSNAGSEESSSTTESSQPSGSSGEKGSVTLSGQNFTEMKIMAAMYEQLLENAGYTVNKKLVTTRDVYMPQLKSGKVDIVPEYLSGIAGFLNRQQNGADAKSITTHDPQQTLKAAKPLLNKAGITLLEPAKATDQNAFAVTKKFAKKHDLQTLSDLGKLDMPIVLAAAKDCKGRPDCEVGLKKVYGINITKILPLGFGTPQTKDSVKKGESQLGLVATTDGALDEEGLVILKDDKGIQPAQNLIPAVNTDFYKQHKDVAKILNPLSKTLTTKDLAEMNAKVGVQRKKPADVAKKYLTDHGLL